MGEIPQDQRFKSRKMRLPNGGKVTAPIQVQGAVRVHKYWGALSI